MRKKIIEKTFQKLNPAQREAVFTIEGPVCVLAGAGTGKTTVLTNRIQYLIQFGNAYQSEFFSHPISDKDVEVLKEYYEDMQSNLAGTLKPYLYQLLSVNPAAPNQILAITHTNKAGDEIKKRLAEMLGTEVAGKISTGTIHSFCTHNILRKNAKYLGYTKNFSIYDTDDQKKVISNILKEKNIDPSELSLEEVKKYIDYQKDNLKQPPDYENESLSNLELKKSQIYQEYQKILKQQDAMDFNDLIFNAVLILEQFPEICEIYQKRYHYILVDEYQDTNRAQDKLIRLLADRYQNLCIIGDDDQSIYSFHGARIENILLFDKKYPKAKILPLEQNYRSSGNILNGANAVIQNNYSRKPKALWTDQEPGKVIVEYAASNQEDEANYICTTIIIKRQDDHKSFSDFAILCRTKKMMSQIEQTCIKDKIPYRILGGHAFFDHAVIKDMMAYLNIIVKPKDNIRLERIINTPKRGIGKTTVDKIRKLAKENNTCMFNILEHADQYDIPLKQAKSGKKLIQILKQAQEDFQAEPFEKAFDSLLFQLNYPSYLNESETKKEKSNIWNKEQEKEQKNNEYLRLFRNHLIDFQTDNPKGSLIDFVREETLRSNENGAKKSKEAITLSTVHSSKGLEYPIVFITGLEEGLFPHQKADEQEERRIMYVAMTRAKEELYLTHSFYRNGRTQTTSDFIHEIPAQYIHRIGTRQRNLLWRIR